MKIKLIILAVMLAAAAVVAGIVFGTKGDAPNTSEVASDGADICTHEYNEIVHFPTCTEKGYTEHTCQKCGDTYNDAETDVAEHNFVAGNITEPTYEADGYTEYVCDGCGASEKRDIVAKLVDNTFVDTVVAPTCTEMGYTVRKYNSDGKEERIDETEALNHDYSDTVVAPTCVDNGYTIHTCENCGDEYRDNETAALGHSYEEEAIKATCTERGYTIHKCKNCGDEYRDDETRARGHKFVAGKVVAPTVTERGYTEYKCSRCGKTEKRDYVDKLPDPDEEQYTDTIIAPTCTEKGYTKRVYEGGRVEYLNYVDELGHIYGVTKTVAPTCTQEGYIVNTCSECGSHYETPTGEPLGHNFVGAWVVETPATATTYGSEYQVCSICNERQYRLIPKIGGDGVVRTDEYMEAHYEAGRIKPESNFYSAADYGTPICKMNIIDNSLNAIVTHTGYLTFRVKFTDNTGTPQEFDVRYEYDDEFIYASYGAKTMTINPDGSYEIGYGGRLTSG